MTRATFLYKRDILDVPDVWRIANSSNDGDNVKADRLPYVLKLHIVVDSLLEILQLVEINCLLWLSEDTASAGLHFHEHYSIPVTGNDVDITPSRLPIALYDGVSFLPQIGCSQVFTPSP